MNLKSYYEKYKFTSAEIEKFENSYLREIIRVRIDSPFNDGSGFDDRFSSEIKMMERKEYLKMAYERYVKTMKDSLNFDSGFVQHLKDPVSEACNNFLTKVRGSRR